MVSWNPLLISTCDPEAPGNPQPTPIANIRVRPHATWCRCEVSGPTRASPGLVLLEALQGKPEAYARPVDPQPYNSRIKIPMFLEGQTDPQKVNRADQGGKWTGFRIRTHVHVAPGTEFVVPRCLPLGLLKED